MTNNKPTRASQSKGESTKVVSQASTIKPKAAVKPWTPPSYLDTPNAPEGFRHRWVRIEIMGFQDTKNIQGRLRSGYELLEPTNIQMRTFQQSWTANTQGLSGTEALC